MYQDEVSQVYNIDAFTGYDHTVTEQLLPPGATVDAQNFEVSDGQLTVTLGNTKYTTALVPGGVKTLMAFYQNLPTGELKMTLLASSSTDVYKYNEVSKTWDSIKTGLRSGYYSFINYQQGSDDIIIMTNGIDEMFKYDGTTFKALGGSPPRCKSISLHYERVWATVNISFPNRVHYSADLEPENWQETEFKGGFIDLPTWDGGVCIGLSTVFDDIVIFKTYNIWKINGTHPGEYEKRQVYSATGAIAPNSIYDAETVCLFLAKDGIYLYDGVQAKSISHPVSKVIKDMNTAYADKAVAVFFNNKYILAIPTGSSTENNCIIEYDLFTKQFIIKRGFNVNTFLVFKDRLLFSNNKGYVLEYNKGDTFDGQPIEAYWYTPYTNLGAPDVVKRSYKIYATIQKLFGEQLKIDGIFDKKSNSILIQLPDNKQDINKRLRCAGRHFKLKISNVNGSRFTLSMPRLHYDADKD